MPRLVRYLMKCFGDSGMRDAADAAHNAFVELFTNWDTVRSPRAWLRTVAFRQMLRQNASAEYPLDVLRQEPATVPASARLELREETQAVLHGLRQLPLAQRQVLALIYDEFSYGEIAQITAPARPRYGRTRKEQAQDERTTRDHHGYRQSFLSDDLGSRSNPPGNRPYTAGPMSGGIGPSPDSWPSSGPS